MVISAVAGVSGIAVVCGVVLVLVAVIFTVQGRARLPLASPRGLGALGVAAFPFLLLLLLLR